MLTKEEIIEVLKTVKDPEVHLDIWTMGLIYDVEAGEETKILMTYTTPFCPWGPDMQAEIVSKLNDAGIKNPIITITFDPPYTMPSELRASLGI
jgi:metal-sulfur cluster biosynthetic enzyme